MDNHHELLHPLITYFILGKLSFIALSGMFAGGFNGYFERANSDN